MRELHAYLGPSASVLLRALERALAGGPAVVPLPPDLPEPRVHRMLETLRPHRVVHPDGEVQTRRDGVACAGGVALVVATSGSTGEPKGVELSADALVSAANACMTALGAGAEHRWLCCLPTWHVAGVQVLVRSLVAGTDPVVHERFDARSVLGARFDYASLVPTMLHRLVEAVGPRRFPEHRALLLGGSATAPGLLAAAIARGANCVVSYGMTETAGGCVYNGQPLSGVEVRLDPDGRVLLRGPMLAAGYRLRPELALADADGWLATTDLGRWAGDRLEILGRIDDIIVCGGRKIIPQLVEEVLASHPGVVAVAVVGRPDLEWGQSPTAYVVPAEAAAPPTLEQLRNHVAQRLEPWHAPRELRYVDQLPWLASGKLDRRSLAA